MEKNYNHQPDENKESLLREPMVEYQRATGIKCSPPLTEEEMKNSISGDELISRMHKFIDELFDKDENSIQ